MNFQLYQSKQLEILKIVKYFLNVLFFCKIDHFFDVDDAQKVSRNLVNALHKAPDIFRDRVRSAFKAGAIDDHHIIGDGARRTCDWISDVRIAQSNYWGPIVFDDRVGTQGGHLNLDGIT